MSKFSIRPLEANNLLEVSSRWNQIDLDPVYQRIPDIWTIRQQKSFIDSIINGFDIPKFYLHELSQPYRVKNGTLIRFAVIDGKQRLKTIQNFLTGKLSLSQDFEYFANPKIDVRGASYKDLAIRSPRLRATFDGFLLPIILLRTDDPELVDEMFERLNRASNLNAAEQRNAIGGPIRDQINILSSHAIFEKNVPFKDGRYKYRELSVKFLHLTRENTFTTTKKSTLDSFTRAFREGRKSGNPDLGTERAAEIAARTSSILDLMHSFFNQKDKLLANTSDFLMFFHLFRLVGQSEGRSTNFGRPPFVWFLNEVRTTRIKVNRAQTEPGIQYDPVLARFIRNRQSLNDGPAVKGSYSIMLDYVQNRFGLSLPYPDTGK